jgi:RNA polymerase sigma factor (sigma-70 family)
MRTGTSRGLDPRDVLAALMTDHGEKWRRFVSKMLRNPADAHDVMQEAVRRLLSTERCFDTEDDVRMYLARAIGNTAIEFYHHRTRERSRRMPLWEHLIASGDGVSPEEQIVERERAERRSQLLQVMREGLTRLPAKQYEALRMTMLDPGTVSIREAGAGNGIPYSTLRHRTLQGIQRLRLHLNRAARTAGSRPTAPWTKNAGSPDVPSHSGEAGSGSTTE